MFTCGEKKKQSSSHTGFARHQHVSHKSIAADNVQQVLHLPNIILGSVTKTEVYLCDRGSQSVPTCFFKS